MITETEAETAKAAICELIAQGNSLASICSKNGIPGRTKVYEWLRDDATFANNYVRAREEQADFYADEIIEIADTEEDPNKARVRIDARKWKAARMKPKSYGDKVQLTGDGGGPLQVAEIRHVIVDPRNPDS